jgi:hypothetical protein
MATDRIAIQLDGPEEEDGDVRVDVFLKQLAAFKKALNETDRVISGSGQSLYYRVSQLTHSSPAFVEYQACIKGDSVPQTLPGQVAEFAYKSIRAIQSNQPPPPELDHNALLAYKEMGSWLGRGIDRLWVRYNGEATSLDTRFAHTIDTIIGADIREIGSVTGYLHHVNLHDQGVFTIYPPVPGMPKLRCIFPRKMRESVVGAVDRYVTVYGVLKYKQREKHPYEMRIDKIEVHPPVDDLPTLKDLLGVAPNSTGGLSSTEYVRSIRDEWE